MSNKVTYADIIEALSRKTGFSKQKTEAFTKALISSVSTELEETGKASITNFGSFKVKEVAERQGQNPQTGEPITIPAHKRISFTPYKGLREGVNEKFAHLETELLGDEKAGSASSLQKEEKPDESKQEEKESAFPFDEEDSKKVEEKADGEPLPEKEIGEDPFTLKESEAETQAEQKEDNEIESVSKITKENEQPEESTNLALVMLVAALLTIALISVWWFFFQTDVANLPAERAAIEQPQTPEAGNQIVAEMESSDQQNESLPAEVEPENEGQNRNPAQISENNSGSAATAAGSTTYRVNRNEWFWVIAKKVYGNSQFWPLIYHANFSVDTHPDSLERNMSLKVPAFEGTMENLSEADYQRLAEASQMVADAYNKHGQIEKAKEYSQLAKKWQNLRS